MNVEVAAPPPRVKPRVLLIGLACLVAAVAGGFALWQHFQPQLTLVLNNAGIQSLKYRGNELLGFGEFRVLEVQLRNASGTLRPADIKGSMHVDAAHLRTTNSFSWGTIETQYQVSGSRLNITIRTRNLSQDTIESLAYEPLGLRFPSKVREYDGMVPLLGHNVGNPTLVTMSFSRGTLVLANEDVLKPLLIGFPWALDKPANTLFPVRVNTGRDERLPDMLPYIHRPIAPGAMDEFTLSLRFGPTGASALGLGSDILEKYAAAFPAQLKWRDRRPVGTVILATVNTKWTKNPRGWFLSPNLDVTTAEGRSEFKQRMLKTADTTIGILRDMNAQGMVMWDVEGQEFASASYVGDPRQFAAFAPEMTDVADEFFKKFRDAGLRVGLCLRASEAVLTSDHKSAVQRDSDDPEKVLIDKILWANHRWGATLFYLDSNGEPARPLDPSILEHVIAKFPDILLIPEHKNVRYFAYTAPYFDMREGIVGTPAAVRSVYPNAFSVVNTADGQLSKRHSDLVAAAKQGDILLFRSWFVDPENAEVKSLYY